MNIDKIQQEFNEFSLAPNFNRADLHYIKVDDKDSFQFSYWNDKLQTNQKRFYCFLTDRDFTMEGWNLTWPKSYVLYVSPIYPIVVNSEDFVEQLRNIKADEIIKCVRQFSEDDINTIRDELKQKFTGLESNFSFTMQGILRVFKIEEKYIVITFSMVYFANTEDVFLNNRVNAKKKS